MTPSLLARACLVIACVWPGLTAAAEQKMLRLGEMELVYDAERWRAEPEGDSTVTMQPVGAIARKLDPVVLSRAPSDGIDSCKALGEQHFLVSNYERPTASPIAVGSISGIRLAAHTRCRNARPKGVVICVPYRGTGYVLRATQISCRSPAHNLFSGVDPLQELLGGMRFNP